MNTAKRSEAFPEPRWGSFGKDGWMTDAYAVGKMIADHKGWTINHLAGLQMMPEDLNERDRGELRAHAPNLPRDQVFFET